MLELWRNFMTWLDEEAEEKYTFSEEDIFEDDPRADILIELSEYADRNPGFDAEFLDSVSRWFDKHGYMSAKQYNCLFSVYLRI